MAQPRSQFRPESPVLWFDPQPPAHALGERHLLWPAWDYSVLAPRASTRNRTLNIIDEAFLRLLQAGQRSRHELERILCLDRSLVAYIYTDLEHRGLCDERGVPTDRGLRALRERGERREELCNGHVYRDPATAAMWGRFVEHRGYAEVEWRRRGSRLVLGPEGSARRVAVLPVAPEQEQEPPAPRPEEVLRELELDRRARAGGDAAARSAAPESAQLARIQRVSARPEAVWLAVTLYATRTEDDGAPWHACDPFGIGSSPPLRRAVERRAATDPQLATLLQELTREGATRRASAASESARRTLGARFGSRLHDMPGLQGSLIDMLLVLEDGHRGPRACAAARAEVRRVVEQMLRMTLGDAGPEIALDLIDDREHDSELIAEHARLLGFESLPRGLRGVGAAQVRSAAEHRGAELPALFCANVLAAARDPEHPLRALSSSRPGYPAWIDALADRPRPPAAEWDAEDRQAELQRLAEETLDTIACLLTTTRAARALEV